MAEIINRICRYCGKKLKRDVYGNMKKPKVEFIVYCDNEECPVMPCTDSTIPTKLYPEILAITGDIE